MSVYTEKLVAEMVAKGSFTFAEAVAFADEHGLKPRSVIAKVKSLGLPYEPKPARVTKRGEPVVTKVETLARIEKALSVSLPSLAKAAKADLETLADVVEKVKG